MTALEDFLHPLRGWYRTSPAWLKRSMGQAYALLPMRFRYGGVLARTRRLIEQSQWWSWEQHQAYQWQRMKALLAHAYENAPYYRRTFDAAGVSPADIRTLDDWHRLPLVTKDDVRTHREEMVARNMRDRMLAMNTGGSTGRPMEFYWERGKSRSVDRAFLWRQWQWGGFRYGQRTAVIRGQTVRDGLWHYDPIDRHLFINMYQMSDANARDILAKLREFAPVSIQAYPSTLMVLAAWMKHHREPPIRGLKVLLCGSENLYPAQKALFQEVFQTRVYSWYGHAEFCCMAGYCDQADIYHVYSEYGYVELIDPEGRVVPWTEGQQGEIVGTSFLNDTMPFIRYRTGDIATIGPPVCTCGRHYRLLARIDGRRQEYIITADGRPIALTGLVFGQHWEAFARIRQLQIVQNEPGRIILHLAPGPGFTPADEHEIRAKVLKCVEQGLDIAFEYVQEIPPTARGKHVFVKQSLPVPSAWAGSASAASESA